MPLYNTEGEAMPEARWTEKELEKWLYLNHIHWPEHKDIVFHLSPRDLHMWIHQLNPREALLLMSTHGIKARIKEQLNWKRWSIVSDWLWRVFH